METTINTKHNQKLEALIIAKRLVDQGVTNDLDTLSSVTSLCKEEIAHYLFKNKKANPE
ncbi:MULTISPECIES: hypothetical protein [Bacillus]|uniref:hypothetical protein n=1 Tax=Bacillus TaxID=1386 RepID=UPI0012FEBFB5|nr:MULTISPECIES: hypothetical protein [Bacillus]